MSDVDNDEIRVEKTPISQFENFAIVMSIAAVVAFLVALSLRSIGASHMLILTGVVSVAWFFFGPGGGAYETLPYQHYGVPTLLGRRRNWFLFGEGLILKIRGIMGVAGVSMERHRTDVIDKTYVTKNVIELDIDFEIYWSVNSPCLYLNTDESIRGEIDSSDHPGLSDVVYQVLVLEIGKYDDDEIFGAGKKDQIIAAVQRAVNIVNTTSHPWGIVANIVKNTRFRPTNEAVRKAWERVSIEKLETVSEGIQAIRFTKNVKMIGEETELGQKLGAAFFLADQEKTPPFTEIKVVGDGGDPMVKTGLIVADVATKLSTALAAKAKR